MNQECQVVSWTQAVTETPASHLKGVPVSSRPVRATWSNPKDLPKETHAHDRHPQHTGMGAKALRHPISENSLAQNNCLSWMPLSPMCQEEGLSQTGSSPLSQTSWTLRTGLGNDTAPPTFPALPGENSHHTVGLEQAFLRGSTGLLYLPCLFHLGAATMGPEGNFKDRIHSAKYKGPPLLALHRSLASTSFPDVAAGYKSRLPWTLNSSTSSSLIICMSVLSSVSAVGSLPR